MCSLSESSSAPARTRRRHLQAAQAPAEVPPHPMLYCPAAQEVHAAHAVAAGAEGDKSAVRSGADQRRTDGRARSRCGPREGRGVGSQAPATTLACEELRADSARAPTRGAGVGPGGATGACDGSCVRRREWGFDGAGQGEGTGSFPATGS